MIHQDRFRTGYSKEYEDGYKKIDWGKKDDANRGKVQGKAKGTDRVSRVGHNK